ncbi:hypothetical protein SEA_STIGMA_232 [Streptomyces phage Stigma]|nr:hypothetical protein SEA_STIGMA_232 [Streptomyces phage Stigma]
MRYKRVNVYFTHGEPAQFNFVIEQQSTDGEYRFENQHSGTRYTVMKRNVNYIERIK